VTTTRFADRIETAFSPRVSLLHKLTDNVSFMVSGYRAFRAPTLNELYRSFRVGSVLTLANDKLRAERLTGGEAGVSVNGFDRKLNVRGTFFWSEIIRPVANVTLSVTPSLITRQRQNLGRTRSRGMEMEAEARISSSVVISGGYQFLDATVLRFPANILLEGLLIPQVPRHLATFQARYSNPRLLTVSFQGRAGSSQFDDDQNQFRLDPYFTLDAFASRSLGHGVEVFGAFENLTGQRYDIGRTPLRTIGPPLLARVGIRFQLGSR
jgi:outer membrane receptor protein involved in Fe transport